MNWRLWLGGAVVVGVLLLGIGKGLRLPLLAGGGKGIVVILVGVLVISALLRRRPSDPPR